MIKYIYMHTKHNQLNVKKIMNEQKHTMPVKFIFTLWKDEIVPACLSCMAPGGLGLTVKRWWRQCCSAKLRRNSLYWAVSFKWSVMCTECEAHSIIPKPIRSAMHLYSVYHSCHAGQPSWSHCTIPDKHGRRQDCGCWLHRLILNIVGWLQKNDVTLPTACLWPCSLGKIC